MSHDIEQFGNDLAAFVSGRQSAWHKLGTVTRHCLTAQEALHAAFLSGWNVRMAPMSAEVRNEDGTITFLEVPGRYATVRDHPITGKAEVLGVVGSKYLAMQNEACADLLNQIVDSSGAHFETAGSLNGGRQMFISMKLPKTMTIGGVDNHDLYLVASTSHDGTAPLRVDATPIRVVCANTLRAAIGTSRGTYSLRHTKSARHSIQQARTALNLSFAYFDNFQQAAERMINETLTTEQFRAIVSQIWPEKKDLPPRAKANAQRRYATLNHLFRFAPTQSNIAETRWAGYQAVVEYLDHFAPAGEDAKRAARVITSEQVNAAKLKAHKLFAAV